MTDIFQYCTNKEPKMQSLAHKTLAYTHITGSSMHFQFHCILVVCKLVNDQYVLFQWLANEWI